MECKICNTPVTFKGEAKVLQKYQVKYYSCNECGFIQTEDPYWLDEAYNSAINYTDTGILSRNLLLSGVAKIIITYLFDKNGKYCDYAGGYGLFTRLMRDCGFDFYWIDPYCQNLTAKGFEYKDSIGKIEFVTAFEVMEHLTSPIEDIKKIRSLSTSILFTTNLYTKGKMPSLTEWWYYGLEHGQHIAIYSKETFDYIAKDIGLNFYTDGKTVHLLTPKKINPFLFKVLVKLGKRSWISSFFNLSSKTVHDMNTLKKQLQSQ